MTPAQHLQMQGFAILPALLDAATCESLASSLRIRGPNSAGARNLLRHDRIRQIASRLQQHLAVHEILSPDHVAVQCTYFEKSIACNWLVPMHRDESIPVAQRIEHAQLQGWSMKDGTLHVIVPASLLGSLVAARVHLDDCGHEDGPLRVIPGSHSRDASEGEAIPCTASRGDVLVMSPLLVHGSSKASGRSKRRVLHFLFGPSSLPMGLRWPEIANDTGHECESPQG